MAAMTAKEKREARDSRLRDEGAKAALEKINQAQITNPLAAASAHGEVAAPSRGRTVIVACKLGVAGYQIQLSKLVDKFEQNMQGGRSVREAERYGPVVVLRGTAYPRGTPPEGFPPPPLIVGGAALNYGIDAEWFEEWLRQHERDPIVTNRMVFAHEKEDAVIGAAKEMTSIQSGLEPINPKGDKRITKSTRGEVSDIAPDDTRSKSRTTSAA